MYEKRVAPEMTATGSTADLARDMSPETSEFRSQLLSDAQDFSLVLGGPLYQLLCRTRLSNDALMMVRRRVLVIGLWDNFGTVRS